MTMARLECGHCGVEDGEGGSIIAQVQLERTTNFKLNADDRLSESLSRGENGKQMAAPPSTAENRRASAN